MTLANRFNLRQRFVITVLGTITLVAILVISALYLIITRYLTDYTYRYWQNYTQTFAESAVFSALLESKERFWFFAQNFKTDSSVLKSAIFSKNNQLLASIGNNQDCPDQPMALLIRKSIAQKDYWCLYEPIHQNSLDTLSGTSTLTYLGYVAVVISKQPLNSLLQQLFWAMLLSIFFFSLFIYTVVWRTSQVFTTTLLELSGILQKRSHGQKGLSATFSGSQDLNKLRQEFNEMLHIIDTYEHQLESNVWERTQELETALNKLRCSAQYQYELMAIIPHEMKTPLTGLKNYLQLAEEKASLIEIERERVPDRCDLTYYLQQGQLCTADIETQITQWLTYASLEAHNKIALHKSQIDIQAFTTRCIAKVQPLCNRNENQIQVQGRPVLLHLDEAILHHVLVNLLSNACKFTHRGTIRLSWKLRASKCIFEINDTGIGIPEQFHQKIFEPFWQVDMGLNRRYGGNGLGLAIVQQFTELLSGHISVSPNIPKGTTFRLSIPIDPN